MTGMNRSPQRAVLMVSALLVISVTALTLHLFPLVPATVKADCGITYNLCIYCEGAYCTPDGQPATGDQYKLPVNSGADLSCIGSSTTCHTPSCQNGDNVPCYSSSLQITGTNCNDSTRYSRTITTCCS
jgi:hypothetical protein